MKVAPRTLVLYARAPRLGAVKRRLLPWLSAEEALSLHLALLEDSLRLLRSVAAATGAQPVLSLSEPCDLLRSGAPGSLAGAASGVEALPQRGGDLGERLLETFTEFLTRRGQREAVVFGSDSPTLPEALLGAAFDRLREGAGLVLGPADDGGYYLIGMRRSEPGLFAGVPWGTSGVLRATLAAAEGRGLRAALLPIWYDVDRPEDLIRIHREVGRSGSAAAPDACGGERAAPGIVPERTREFVERLARAGRLGL